MYYVDCRECHSSNTHTQVLKDSPIVLYVQCTVCCTAPRRRDRSARAGGEQEGSSTDDAESEGSELSQDLLNEADLEQLVREAETFTVLPVQRSKISTSARKNEDEGMITLEPIVSPVGNHTPNEWETTSEHGSEIASLNSSLEPVLTSHEGPPLERDFSPLALTLLEEEEPATSTEQHTDELKLLTPTTPLATASNVDSSDGVTPTQAAEDEETDQCEGTSGDVVQLLTDEDQQTPEVVVPTVADSSGPPAQGPSDTVDSCNDTTGEEPQRHPSPAHSFSAYSGSSGEYTSPMPVTGDRLAGLAHGRNPFDDSDTEDDNEEGEGAGKDTVGLGVDENKGGCDGEERMVQLPTSESPKQQDEVGEGPGSGEYPFTPEEITTILDKGEDHKLEGFLDEYDIVDALQEDYYTKEVCA